MIDDVIREVGVFYIKYVRYTYGRNITVSGPDVACGSSLKLVIQNICVLRHKVDHSEEPLSAFILQSCCFHLDNIPVLFLKLSLSNTCLLIS
jgi:hypothetical protein